MLVSDSHRAVSECNGQARSGGAGRLVQRDLDQMGGDENGSHRFHHRVLRGLDCVLAAPFARLFRRHLGLAGFAKCTIDPVRPTPAAAVARKGVVVTAATFIDELRSVHRFTSSPVFVTRPSLARARESSKTADWATRICCAVRGALCRDRPVCTADVQLVRLQPRMPRLNRTAE